MVNLAYGKNIIKFDQTNLSDCDVILPRDCSVITDTPSTLRDIMARPENGARLYKLAKGAGRVVILVPDATRGDHFATLIPVLLDELFKAGLSQKDVSLLICGGTHQKVSRQQALKLLGKAAEICPYYIHDADDADMLVSLGKTEYGTELKVNRLLKDAFVIGLGIVKHHYYAGYSGGRKIVLPGASARSSIKQNHSRCFLKDQAKRDPDAINAKLKGNPVHDDMQAASKMVNLAYSVQLVLGPSRKPVGIFAGSPDEAFTNAVKEADRISLFEDAQKYQWVIASCGGFPGDMNFLQAHKTIHHAYSFLKPKGSIIVLAECSGGMGWDEIVDWAKIGHIPTIIEKLKSSYELAGQTTMAMLEKAESAKIYLLSSLPEEIVRSLKMIPIKTLDEGLKHLSTISGSGAILPQADLTVHR